MKGQYRVNFRAVKRYLLKCCVGAERLACALMMGAGGLLCLGSKAPRLGGVGGWCLRCSGLIGRYVVVSRVFGEEQLKRGGWGGGGL